jgi:D-alanine-D-alanine ligase
MAERMSFSFSERTKVWVLAPHLITDDADINYYYDFTQSIEEYTRCFAVLQLNWQWQPVTMNDFRSVIDEIVSEQRSGVAEPIVLNLCDGDEINGAPGISVVEYLEQCGLVYTGADAHFYRITTSKIPMKQAFDAEDVPTPAWKPIHAEQQNTEQFFEQLGIPFIVKPAVSGGSMGVGIRNVVHTPAELNEQMHRMFAGYRGWNLAGDGLIAESFINGREFTTMVVGSAQFPQHCKVLTPVERVFHASLPAEEKFLSFDRLWETYTEEEPMPENANFYEYAVPEASLHAALQEISLAAYRATGGTGYTRVDIRQDDRTGRLYVLEVNAQCGLSEDENFTSIGAILRYSHFSFPELIREILLDACRRKHSVSSYLTASI